MALLPPLFGLLTTGEGNWHIWIYRALTFLVISCPCALVISVPLSFFASIGSAGRAGILIKGSNYVERLADVKTVVFDKTGTLTRGIFGVTAVHPAKEFFAEAMREGKSPEEELLHLAAHVESISTHPIAESLRRAYKADGDGCKVEGGEEVPGKGIRASVNGKTVCVGNSLFMESVGAVVPDCRCDGTIIHVAVDGVYAGHVAVSDALKPHSKEAVKALRNEGVKKLVLPADKVERAEALLQETNAADGFLAFVGDGLNDAPVLARADVGIAMGAMGSDAAVEAADVVLMDDDPLKISVAVKIARKCMAIVKENIYIAIGIKVLVLILGAVGIANMWFAIFADVGVMVLAVLNSMRTLLMRKVQA